MLKNKQLFSKVIKSFLEFIYPSNLSCSMCDCDLKKKTKTHICDKCKKELPFIKNPCKKCGKEVEEDSSCFTCTTKKWYFDRAMAVVNFDDNAKYSIYKFKKFGKRYMADFMSYYMYCVYVNNNINADCIACVPMHESKLKERGFNQAEDLLCEINSFLHLEDVSECILQQNVTTSQKELTSLEREKIVRDKYKLCKISKLKGKSILLVDDVFTTGATTNRIAQILKWAGAEKVYILTFATVNLHFMGD